MSIRYHDLNVGVTLGGGGGATAYPQYEIRGLHGSNQGDLRETLSCSVSGLAGAKCLLVVMHRAAITSVSNGMTFVYKTSDGWQWISIYEKIMQADSETYVVTQASSARICSISVLTSAETSVSYSGKIDAVSVDNYDLTIPAQSKVTLVALSDGYSSGKKRKSGPYVYSYQSLESSISWRLCVAIVNNLSSVTISNAYSTGSQDMYNNWHAYLFTLERSA